jgi:hypothetical protein
LEENPTREERFFLVGAVTLKVDGRARFGFVLFWGGIAWCRPVLLPFVGFADLKGNRNAHTVAMMADARLLFLLLLEFAIICVNTGD